MATIKAYSEMTREEKIKAIKELPLSEKEKKNEKKQKKKQRKRILW